MLPGSADDVTIDFGSNTIQHDAGTDVVHSLTTTNPFTIAGGELSVVTSVLAIKTSRTSAANPKCGMTDRIGRRCLSSLSV